MRLVEIHKPNVVMTEETKDDEIKIKRFFKKIEGLGLLSTDLICK
jgi:hypothetical protein